MAPYEAVRGRRACRIPVSPREILPVELWDLVLQADLVDSELLSLATVCRLFHSLAIRIALRQSGLGPTLYTDEELHPTPHELRILYLSFSTFAVRHITVKLVLATLRRDLYLLHAVVNASKSLIKLDLKFDCDLLTAPIDDRAGLLHSLTDILALVAQRVSAPVVVLFDQEMWPCRPEHILSWNLHSFGGQFSATTAPLTKEQRKRHHEFVDDDSIFRRTEATMYNGEQKYVFRLATLSSASIDCTPHFDQRAFTLITLDAVTIDFISFYPSRNDLRGSVIPVVLGYAVLPNLHTVHLHFPSDDGSHITQFLARHTTVKTIVTAHTSSYLYRMQTQEKSPPVNLFPPLSHQGITTLETDCFNRQASPILPSPLPSLITSPNLRNILYSLPGRPGHQFVEPFTADLQLIATLVQHISLTLESGPSGDASEPLKAPVVRARSRSLRPRRLGTSLRNSREDEGFWYDHPTILAVVPTLNPVHHLTLTLHSIAEARRMLALVALLPALESLKVEIFPEESLLSFDDSDSDTSKDTAARSEAVKRRARKRREKAAEANVFASEIRRQLHVAVEVDVQIF